MTVLLREVEVRGRVVDVRLVEDRVAQLGMRLDARPDDEVVEGDGGALLPGLHDHHLHLMALAAAGASVPCGPPAVHDEAGLRRALAQAPAGFWVRGTGYHESVAGHLDRHVLDRLAPGRRVRVQHRSGALWVLSTPALVELGLTDEPSPDVERDDRGVLTGRLWRWDDRLRERLAAEPPDLHDVERRLAEVGLTGVTDATPDLDAATCRRLRDGVRQHLRLLGDPGGQAPRKLLLRDHDLPSYDELAGAIHQAHRSHRAVAVHCVTRDSLVLTLAVLEQVGVRPGDRIEHAAVVRAELVAPLARTGVSVVTQPTFLAERGDDYLRDVPPADRPFLYPYASLLKAGVRVAPSSDAPFGDVDPWRGIAAAVHRRSQSGAVVGVHGSRRGPSSRVTSPRCTTREARRAASCPARPPTCACYACRSRRRWPTRRLVRSAAPGSAVLTHPPSY